MGSSSGTSSQARREALAAAIEPFNRVIEMLRDPTIVKRLAASLPPETDWRQAVHAFGDPDTRDAMAPIRFCGLYAAEAARAAYLVDWCNGDALWNWRVDDPTWRAALDAIDVAMTVAGLRLEGRAVGGAMAETHRRIVEIAGEDR